MRSRSGWSVARVLLVILFLGGAATGSAIGGYLITDRVRGSGTEAAASAPLPAITGITAAPPTSSAGSGHPALPAKLAARLAAPLADAALGGRLLAQVVDVGTGTVLLDQSAATTAAPASAGKLLTAAAILTVHAPSDRFTTRVVAGAPGTVVLVGGGDPTLSAAPPGQPTDYPNAARLSDLAERVKAAHLAVSRVVVDDSLFAGPAISPDWAPGDVPSDFGAGITAVMADGGRAQPGDTIRSAEPDLAAGQRLADLLGVPAAQVTRGTAPAGAKVVAAVPSAPVSDLVEQMLQQSDNVIAECLGRQVALAVHQPATFRGGAAAIRATVRGLGVDPGGGMLDASGLAARDRVSPATLADVLRLSGGDAHPMLHDVVAALPVAAWSGTLADRYLPGASNAGAGTVRAKTGTLTSVSALAGLVHDADGRLLAFALIADRVAPSVAATDAAEAALDRIAAALAGCGCH